MNKRKKYILTAVVAAALIAVIGYDTLKFDYKTAEKSDIAMGTVVSACIYSGDENTAENIIADIKNTESEISKNISTSYISKLNANGTVNVDDSTAELIKLCCKIYNLSDGAFDVTTGGLSQLWDIGGENSCVPSEKSLKSALKSVDGSRLKVNDNNVTADKGQTVDLGAVGKGYAADKALKLLKNADIKGAVVSVGGSVLLYGKHNALSEKWSVALRNPFGQASDYAGILQLDDCFVSTSGTYERYFEDDGKRYHHILSTVDGYPIENGLESVTVISDMGALSDALSTACFAVGIEKAMELIDALSQDAVFIDSNKNIYLTEGIKNSFTLCSDEFTIVDYELQK